MNIYAYLGEQNTPLEFSQVNRKHPVYLQCSFFQSFQILFGWFFSCRIRVQCRSCVSRTRSNSIGVSECSYIILWFNILCSNRFSFRYNWILLYEYYYSRIAMSLLIRCIITFTKIETIRNEPDINFTCCGIKYCKLLIYEVVLHYKISSQYANEVSLISNIIVTVSAKHITKIFFRDNRYILICINVQIYFLRFIYVSVIKVQIFQINILYCYLCIFPAKSCLILKVVNYINSVKSYN